MKLLIKYLLCSHRKTTAIIRSFCSTYHKATRCRGWEPVANTNHTERFLPGFELKYDYEASWFVEIESTPVAVLPLMLFMLLRVE
jgi:hypothetical protein